MERRRLQLRVTPDMLRVHQKAVVLQPVVAADGELEVKGAELILWFCLVVPTLQ